MRRRRVPGDRAGGLRHRPLGARRRVVRLNNALTGSSSVRELPVLPQGEPVGPSTCCSVDYAKWSRCSGAAGAPRPTMDELDAALAQAKKNKGLSLIDVRVPENSITVQMRSRPGRPLPPPSRSVPRRSPGTESSHADPRRRGGATAALCVSALCVRCGCFLEDCPVLACGADATRSPHQGSVFDDAEAPSPSRAGER